MTFYLHMSYIYSVIVDHKTLKNIFYNRILLLAIFVHWKKLRAFVYRNLQKLINVRRISGLFLRIEISTSRKYVIHL